MQNLQSKTPYKFKNSYGGTPEPLPPEYPPCRRGPSLKIHIIKTRKYYFPLCRNFISFGIYEYIGAACVETLSNIVAETSKSARMKRLAVLYNPC